MRYYVEQYIYSRSEREFVNSLGQTIPLGFGFMALSPGMDNRLKRNVAIHCEDCPRLSLVDGGKWEKPLSLFRKALLPGGQVLLQKSVRVEGSDRDFHVAHGYVLDNMAARFTGPAKWLCAPFRLEDPNKAPGGIPPLESWIGLPRQKPLKFHDLKDAALGLDQELFCRMLLACFDAVVSRQQVLIVWDFELPRERALRESVLYWIYTCLPYDLRIRLGFDSVYTDKSSPGEVQLAFVDKALVRGESALPYIQLGNQPVPLGGNFLIRDGEIIHNDGRYQTEWYCEDVGYAGWLRQLVNIVWNCPKEKREAVVSEMENVWNSLQSELPTEPGKGQLNIEEYRRACDKYYMLPELRRVAGLPSPSAAGHSKTVKKREPNPEEVFHRIFQRENKSFNEKNLLALSDIRGEMEPAAIGLLSAFMLWEADVEKARVSAVLERYRDLLPGVYDQLSYRMFWGGLSDWDLAVWKEFGVKNDGEAAGLRRFRWYKEIYEKILPRFKKTTDLTAHIRCCLNELPGINREERNSMENEFLQWVLNSVFFRYEIPANAGDIQLLSSICGGSKGGVALGFLGAFMAGEFDASKEKLYQVFARYREHLPPDIYSQLPIRLFWNQLADEERISWKKCGVKSSEGIARQRRFKWYDEILPAYSPPKDAASFVECWINTLPGIDGWYQRAMKEELRDKIKRRLDVRE